MSDNGKKNLKGCLIVLIVFIILAILAMAGSGMENDYDRAGRQFETWTKQDPSTWTDTQNQYFNDFWEWADKN